LGFDVTNVCYEGKVGERTEGGKKLFCPVP